MANRERLDAEFRKQFRENRGDRTQKQMAEELTEAGYPIDHIGVSRLERGERGVSLELATAAANVFDVPLDSLLGRRYGPSDDLAYALRAVDRLARRIGGELDQMIDELDDTCAQVSGFDFVDRKQFDNVWKLVIGELREARRHMLVLSNFEVEGRVRVVPGAVDAHAENKRRNDEVVDKLRKSIARKGGIFGEVSE